MCPPRPPCSALRHARIASTCAPRWRCIDSRKSWASSKTWCNQKPRLRLRAPLAPPNGRRSVTRSAALRGTGLHTGAATEATFLPAPAGQGIVFRRTDLAGKPEVPARLTEVEAVERRTAIGHGEATIHTVEHVLAAGAAHVIDDLTIRLPRPEPPLPDRSRPPYFLALTKGGAASGGGGARGVPLPAPL